MKKSDSEITALSKPVVYAAPNEKLRRVDLFTDPDTPLSVSVSTFGTVANELAVLYWQDPDVSVDSQPVLQDEVNAGNKILKVLPIDIINQLVGPEPGYGVHRVFYEMHNLVNGGISDSDVREITVRILVPGGEYNIDPKDPYVNENLQPPQDIPPVIDDSTVFPVRVRIVPYDNMREGDRLRLRWNGREFDYGPLTAGEVNNPVYFDISLADMENKIGAGAGQIVRYDVHDIVNNWSLWSPSTLTDVEVGPDLLRPPRTPDWPTRIIDLALLGTADVRIEVPGAGLEDHDSVQLFWAGETAAGIPITDDQTKPVPVGDGGYSLFFTIENRLVTAIPQGSAVVRYEVTRAGVPLPMPSRRLTLSVIGSVQQLPLPILRENNGGVVDPNLVPAGGALATVLEYTPMMKEGDIIILCGDGIKSDSSLSTYRSPPKPVFANMVGQDVEFLLDKTYLAGLVGGTLELYYLIDLVSGPPQQKSLVLPLSILGQPLRLPEPSVDHERGGKLDPDTVPPSGTIARVPATANTLERDRVYLYWRGNGPTNSYDTSFPIGASQAGREVPFPIEMKYITGNLGQSVTVEYDVERPTGSGNFIPSRPLVFVVEGAESLPAPYVEGVADGGILDPGQITQVWVRVLGDSLLEGDEVSIVWTDESGGVLPYRSDPKPYTFNDVPNGLRFLVSSADVSRFLDKTVKVTYERDRDGVITGPSQAFTMTVGVPLPLEPFKVMGARYTRTTYRASGSSRILSAFHANTQQPLAVEWKYADNPNWSAPSATWRDTQPSKALDVRSSSQVATLNPANIFGSGDDTSVSGEAAFVALRNSGDVIGWGNSAFGAAAPSDLRNIVGISSTSAAFAALDSAGNVRVWGDATRGAGNMGGLVSSNFLDVVGNFNAFAGIKGNHQVVAWGANRQGTLVPDIFQGYVDVIEAAAASRGFAIHRSGGPAVSWSEAGFGGAGYPGGLTNVVEMMGSYAAFAVLLSNGSVLAWGEPGYGGSLPGGLSGIARLFCSNAQAFCVQRLSGQVEAWGTQEYGGLVPQAIKDYTDIVEVVSTWRAFAARRIGGEVVAWGFADQGGSAPTGLTDVVQIAGSAEAFAALLRDGRVVAWGNPAVGGATAAVASRLVNVQALYGNSHGFTALTASGDVVAWGHVGGGGNNDAVIGQLRNNVSYYRAPPAQRVPAQQAGRASRTL